MGLPEKEQTRLYETYWAPIERLFRGADQTFDAFARDFMALKTGATRQIRHDTIYQEFRSFWQGPHAGTPNSALEEMLRYAGYYAAFSLARGTRVASIQDRLSRLHRLAEVAALIVVKLFDCYERTGTLSEEQFGEALELLESYIVRRAVCASQARNYWQTLASIARKLNPQEPLLSLKVALHRLHVTYRFPDDVQFGTELQRRNLYEMRNCHYLLDRLENHGNHEPVDTSSYTVEHILPQNTNMHPDWQQMLGSDWSAVQQRWLHRLGNLTLTGYNSSYSDRPFLEKKSISGGFSESSVRLNRFVREQPVWNEPTMEERSRLLTQLALRVWPALQVSGDAVRLAENQELKLKAAERSLGSVEMDAGARALFQQLQGNLCGLGDDVIEVPETSSVSYHAADFFAEVLPRKGRLLLLIDIDFAECEDPDGIAHNTAEHKFFMNAHYSAGTFCHVRSEGDISKAVRLVRQAYLLSRA
jgi:predicted transport protein